VDRPRTSRRVGGARVAPADTGPRNSMDDGGTTDRDFRTQLRTLRADVRADYDAILEAQAKYRGGARREPLLLAMIQKIGLQMMVSYRVMRFFRGIGWT